MIRVGLALAGRHRVRGYRRALLMWILQQPLRFNPSLPSARHRSCAGRRSADVQEQALREAAHPRSAVGSAIEAMRYVIAMDSENAAFALLAEVRRLRELCRRQERQIEHARKTNAVLTVMPYLLPQETTTP